MYVDFDHHDDFDFVDDYDVLGGGMADILRLTWSPRYRGEGAGIGDADEVTDASPTWEGYFELKVWVNGVAVATITPIDDDRYVFSMNQLKNYASAAGCSGAPCLPNVIIFWLRNCRSSGGVTYCTPWEVLRVSIKTGTTDECSNCASATTTSTTTTTSTSTTTATSSTSSTTTTS